MHHFVFSQPFSGENLAFQFNARARLVELGVIIFIIKRRVLSTGVVGDANDEAEEEKESHVQGQSIGKRQD